MTAMPDSSHHHDRQTILSHRTGKIIAWLALIGLTLVIIDHWAHVLGILPYLVLLACPLLHLFHGHGQHHHHDRSQSESGSNKET